MNCEYAKANAALLVYDELADDAKFELEHHLQGCAGCAGEVESLRRLRTAMSAIVLPEPSPNLLAASRMRLQEALETAEQNAGWRRFTFDLGRWFSQIKLAPALSMALLIMGFAAGVGTTYQIAQNRGGGNGPVQPGGGNGRPTDNASVAAISAINPVPNTNKVEIKYDTLVHQETQGSLDDPRIQQLLLFAAHNNVNSGVRLDSQDLLAQKAGDERVRESLMYSLRYDSNPGVRLKALEALQNYVKDDARVRDAVLEALMNDSSPGVRTLAIHALEPARADGSVRRVMADLARNDHNQYIRRKAQEVLNTTGDIE
ncbi:MAG TPA: HEAT repeat domain-containing protein [Terriglobales bacterium]|nr:HEAT repeat domain-containing protein [Terriglobales bacterium]